MRRRGVIRRIILHTLNRRGPLHVYGIIKSIKELSFNTYTPSTGVIYPALKNLLKNGLIRDIEDDGKKLYEITDKGRVAISLDPPITEIFEKIIKTGFPYKEISDIARLIYDNWGSLEDREKEEIKRILEEAFSRIEKLVREDEEDN